MSGVGARTYQQTKDTVVDDVIVGSDIQTSTSTLSATAQIAAYFSKDLRDFLAKTHISLNTALNSPTLLNGDDDPDLLLTLVCSDIDQLLADQLIDGMILQLSDATPSNDWQYKLFYRARYEVRRSLTNSSGQSTPAEQRGGRLEPPRAVGSDTIFNILIHWKPGTEQLRERLVVFPRYNFTWIPTSIARYDDQYLAPGVPIGGMTTTDGEWTVNRLEQNTPEEFRRRMKRGT